MNIQYRIDFHSQWHCGSGLAAGADVDALAIKDSDGLPYVPGKTIKGLIREAVDEMIALQDGKQEFVPTPEYLKTFGYVGKDYDDMHKSSTFFTNATLSNDEHDAIVSNNVARFMYGSVSQTAIDPRTGIAREHSLRKTEVVVPCTLYGDILDVPEEMIDVLIASFGYIKTLGLGRNRGLGRCTISIDTGKETEA